MTADEAAAVEGGRGGSCLAEERDVVVGRCALRLDPGPTSFQ